MHLADIAEWVNLQDGAGDQIAKRLLDNWFNTKWAMKVDYKPKFLAENLGNIYSPVAVPPDEEPDPEAINARRLKEHRQQKERELQRQISGDGAVPPPGTLDEMLATIGRQLK
jgi:hypothetical protein